MVARISARRLDPDWVNAWVPISDPRGLSYGRCVLIKGLLRGYSLHCYNNLSVKILMHSFML